MFTFSWRLLFLCMATAMAERQRRGIEALACCLLCMATAMAERQRRGIEALACCLLCMATAMAERQRRGIEALACCFFLYGDCHGREAASRHRGSCLLLVSVWRLPWPRGSVAASRLLLVAFFYMATAMAERQRRRSFALTPLSAAPHQSVRTSTHRLLPFLLFH